MRRRPASVADVSPAVESVILQVRGPRVLAAMLVGAALAVAGTAFQGLFRNPLVSPDILGASSGAALGAVLGIYLSLGVFAIQTIAFVGGLIAVGRGLCDRRVGAFARSDPGAGTDRRRGRIAVRRRRRPREISRRPLQPASGHDVLAAGQSVSDRGSGSAAAVRSGRGRCRRADRIALAHERDVASGGGSARARRRHRAVAHRHRCRRDARDLRKRRHRRDHRLGRTRGAASGAVAGRPRFCAAAAGGGDPRRRLSLC